MSGVAKLTDSAVIPNIYIKDKAVNCTKPDDEKQTEQGNANHAKPLTAQSDEPSGMELLTQIADQFRGLKTGSWQAIATAAEQRRRNRNSIITIRDKGVSVAGIEEPTEPVSQAMTYAMQRLKVWEIPYIYNTKLGVSPTHFEPEHATPVPANDATKQPVVSAAAIASLQEIADRFRGLKCSTRASVWVAGQEIILPIPDCVAATSPREIVLDGVPVMWPWDYSISDELLEIVRRDVRSYAFHDGQNICLLRPRQGSGSPEEIIGKLRAADTAA